MTGPNRNLGASEPWGRATEKEIEELKDRLRKLEGGRRIVAKGQSVLADLVAKAEVQDQLLQDRLNFQDVVTYSTEPPFSNDTAEEDPNDGIGETFPLPDPSEPINPDNPGGDSSDSDFPPPDPEESIPEPEYRWIQEDPLRGVIEGEWTLVDGVWEPRQVGSDYVADGAIIRDKIEQAVLNDIDEANSTANEAVIAANGKNTIYRGPNLPIPPTNGFNEGDTWFDTSDGDTTIKSWSGSAWTVQEVGTESLAVGAITAESGIIASLDAGVISTGTLNADRIDSRSITADKLLIGDFENLFDTVPFELGSPEGWEIDGSPSFSSWTADSVRVYPGTAVGRIRNTRFNVTEPGDQYFVKIPYQKHGSAGTISLYARLTSSAGTTTNTAVAEFSGSSGTIATVFTIPSNTVSVMFYLHWTAGSSPFTFGTPIVRRMVGGTLIEDDAITTTKIAADAIEANHIKANAITAPKIGAGAVTARSLNVIAEEDNRRLSILPDGLRLWGDTASGGDPNISLTTSGADYFSITSDGATVAGMDNEGTVTGNVISAAEAIEIAGENVVDMIEETSLGGVVWGDQAVNARSATCGAGSSNSGYIELMELSFDVEEGRTYQIYAHPISVYISNDVYCSFRATYTQATSGVPATPTVNSAAFGAGYFGVARPRGINTTTMIPIGGTITWTPGFTGAVRVLFFLRGYSHAAGSGGTITVYDSATGGACRVNVFDMGIRDVGGNMAANRTRIINSTGGSTGGGDPAPKKTYTNTWTANNSATYTGSGSLYSYAGRDVYQGYWLASNGNFRGLWTFPSTVWSTTSGSEVTKVRLYVKNSHARWNAGLTAYFGTHARSTLANPGTTRSNGWTTSFAKGEGKWITLSGSALSYFKTRLQGGNPVGMMIYTTGSDNYGYFDGTARIEVTYKK